MIEVNILLAEIVTEYSKILKDNLVGIYLHGSLAMKCFNNIKSDIDFLVVVNEKPRFEQMRSLVDVLLSRSQECPAKGFEMSVMLRKDTVSFSYPPPFVLHYSNFHKERYITNPDYICGGFEDPDLAAHIMVTRERGIRLFGEAIETVFEPILKQYYVDAIVADISEAKDEILKNPTYYVLNLCRVLYYLKEEVISSKSEGGTWGAIHLINEYRDTIRLALQDYENNNEVSNWEAEKLNSFAAYMLEQINSQLKDLK